MEPISVIDGSFFGQALARVAFALAVLPSEEILTVVELVELVCTGPKKTETNNGKNKRDQFRERDTFPRFH